MRPLARTRTFSRTDLVITGMIVTGVTTIIVTRSVEEAVLPADRVLVTSAGPERIDNDFRIELARA